MFIPYWIRPYKVDPDATSVAVTAYGWKGYRLSLRGLFLWHRCETFDMDAEFIMDVNSSELTECWLKGYHKHTWFGFIDTPLHLKRWRRDS